MDSATPTRDLGLTLPITGVQLIEASAGTGKTFTLATLVARLVIECRLPVQQILAVTFTEAATRELRMRIRERLALAADIADGQAVDRAQEDQRLTAELVQAALAAGENPLALRARLRQAAEAMDMAPVYTIHGFCARALADHALEAAQPLGDIDLIENERGLREQVATDLWRQCSGDLDDALGLHQLWSSPSALAQTLPSLLSVAVLLPEAPAFPVAMDIGPLLETRAALAASFRNHGQVARQLLSQAWAQKNVHASVVKDEAVDPVWQALAEWVEWPRDSDPEIINLERYGSAALAQKANKGKVPPASVMFDAIDAWLAARVAAHAAQQSRRLRLVHWLHDQARQRIAALKRERRVQGYEDMIGRVDDALAADGGERFAQRLRQQYRVALVDEFQDTDLRQWTIFRRLFAETAAASDAGASATVPQVRALFLIGDPKQAIYRFRGGDVHTYVEAAASADARHSLARNFRSRPKVLEATQALYAAAGAEAFDHDTIGFVEVSAGGLVHDDDFIIAGESAPGLNVLTLPDNDGKPLAADEARALATMATVAGIRQLLAPAHAQLRERDELRAVRPGDIAVLVESHKQAGLVQRALVRAGVPCVAAGKQSLYASDEAQDLLCLFEALLHPADEGLLRAALATPLLGFDAGAIAALDRDADRQRDCQQRALAWRQRWDRHGSLALVNDLCAERAPSLLQLDDGERRLTNWLQLAEVLQSDAGTTGDCAALLRERIMAADEDNDAELLRLESDAACVKVLTLHASKGLEFPLVFMPFASMSGGGHARGKFRLARFHDGTQRVARLRLDGDPDWKTAQEQERREERAEKLRLFYVGLTRARLATWLCWGAVNKQSPPLAWLLHREAGAEPAKLDAAGIARRLQRLQTTAPQAIAVSAAPTLLPAGVPLLEPAPAAPPAARVRRTLARDWWVYSFSQLVREDSGSGQSRAHDENESAPGPANSRFSGARFGNVLHQALEHVDPLRWRDWRDDQAPPGEAGVIEAALRSEAYASAADRDAGGRLLAQLVRNTLNVRLPEGIRLADLPARAQRHEMEFHFGLRATAGEAVLDLLHRHGQVLTRRTFGNRARLEGLLTGFIDLVYEHDGRYYLLDYKSNQLRDYGDAALAAAISDAEYDLQYLLYALALHRWLRFRLPGYDYDQHFGGVRYLFCRGLDPSRADSPGVFATKPARALIAALDELFQGESTAAGVSS